MPVGARQERAVPRSLAARAGRWSARHWRTAVLGWCLFVLATASLSALVPAREATDAENASGESRRAERILERAGFAEAADESLLVQHPSEPVSDPAFQAVVGEVVATLQRQRDVADVTAPSGREGGAGLGRDGRSALVTFRVPGDRRQAAKRIGPIEEAVRQVRLDHPEYSIAQFGSASAQRELDATVLADLHRAELLSVPLTLLVLVVAFGALVAASVPVVLAFTAVLATYGLAGAASHLVPESDATRSVILLIGMAVGVDYSLFYLRREREEAAGGRPGAVALEVAAATSGRAVLLSGVTVIVAMAGILLAGDVTFTSVGVGAILVVLVALVGSLSVLPALLARLGHRVEGGRVRPLGRRRDPAVVGGAWARIAAAAVRRPLLAVLLPGLVLLALAMPATRMTTRIESVADLPRDLPVVRAHDRIQAAFPGSQVTAMVVLRAADVTSPEARRAIRDLGARAVASAVMGEPVAVRINPARTVAAIVVPLQGDGDGAASRDALNLLRGPVVDQTVGRLPGAAVAVTGQTAQIVDFSGLVRRRAPLVFGFVLGLAFLLLLVTFHSVVIPLKAIVLNLLSLAASYGVLVVVFQFGWGNELLGAERTGGIVNWLPTFLFVVLFGLSMDYHIFILSRVKELVDHGTETGEAVERALRATAGTVTSAAAVMVVVFAVFVTLRLVSLKQAGFGLAVAVLLDATVIRAVLLPASMKLLGRWNWYLPRWLGWLPSLEPGRHEAARASRLATGRGRRSTV
jgi:uncharacterized membrane protein YdfJ with MMPL/SSD domain